LLPAGFYTVFVALVFEKSKYEVYTFLGEGSKADNYDNKAEKLLSIIGYLTATCNLVSCLIMVLVLRLVKKVIDQAKFKEKGLKSALESNNLVIAAHVILIAVYTVLSIFHFNIKATNGSSGGTTYFRWTSAWTIGGAVADLFISCTLWIVTDYNQSPVALRQGNRSTLVLDVIKSSSSLINDEYGELHENSNQSENYSFIYNYSTIGDRLIAQFFKESLHSPNSFFYE